MDGPDCLIRRHPQTGTISEGNHMKFRSQPPDARYQQPVESRRDSWLPPGMGVRGRKDRWNKCTLDTWPEQWTRQKGRFTSACIPEDKTLQLLKGGNKSSLSFGMFQFLPLPVLRHAHLPETDHTL